MIAVTLSLARGCDTVLIDLAQFHLIPAIDGLLVNYAVDAIGTIVVVEDAVILIAYGHLRLRWLVRAFLCWKARV